MTLLLLLDDNLSASNKPVLFYTIEPLNELLPGVAQLTDIHRGSGFGYTLGTGINFELSVWNTKS